jgi:hypothetical protein
LIVANLAERDAIMAAVETGMRTPDLTPAGRTAPAVRYAAELSSICSQRKMWFEIHGNNSRALGSWRHNDPFEETR